MERVDAHLDLLVSLGNGVGDEQALEPVSCLFREQCTIPRVDIHQQKMTEASGLLRETARPSSRSPYPQQSEG
jgi:hypothetical protein